MSVREKIRQAAQGTSNVTEPKVAAPEQASNGDKAEAKAPKAPRVAKVAGPCKCQVPGDKGCNGATTKGVFAPGHDAKLTGHLTRQVVAGNLTADEAVEDMKAKGGSDLLQGKLRAAIARETTKVQKREAAAKAKEDAKAEKEAQLQFARDEAAKVKADNEAKQAD